MYDVNDKFENLVLFMAENYNSYDTELNDAITTFEEAIETSGNGEAAFGIARDDWNESRSLSLRISATMLSSTQNTMTDSKLHSWSAPGTDLSTN